MSRSAMLLTLAALGAGIPAAGAAECGANGSPDVLRVTNWSVDVSPDRMGMITAKVMIEVENVTPHPIRMVSGGVSFEDALGGYISYIGIERDLHVAPGQTAAWEAEYGGSGLERVPDLVPSEVAVIACVQAALYDDGTKWEFEPEPDTSLADELQRIIEGK